MRNIEIQEHVFERLMTKRELIHFSMFYAICTADDPFIVTNDNSVIMGQVRPSSPLWIYINRDLSNDERAEVVKTISERLELNTSLNVDGEEKYLESILEEVSSACSIPFKVSLPKNSYFCSKVIKPDGSSGYLSHATESDLETISIFCRDNWEDIGFGALTSEQANKLARRRIENPDFYVWRNEDKRIVAMATVHKYGKAVLTDGVFTNRDERNKGYAKFLMYKITDDLLNDGFMPMLYADRRNAVSNHVYKSLGYEYYGEITEYRTIR